MFLKIAGVIGADAVCIIARVIALVSFTYLTNYVI